MCLLEILTFIIFLRPEFLYQVLNLPGEPTFNLDQFETNPGVSRSTGVRLMWHQSVVGVGRSLLNHLHAFLLRSSLSLFVLSQNPPNSNSYQLPISSLLNPRSTFYFFPEVQEYAGCLPIASQFQSHHFNTLDWDSGNRISQTSLPLCQFCQLAAAEGYGRREEQSGFLPVYCPFCQFIAQHW